MIELVNVSKSYEGAGGKEVLSVLRDVSLRVEAGKTVAIVGPSGSGKSTLLNIAGALDVPTSGEVLLAGADIGKLGDKELAKVRNVDVGFIFQLHHLLPQCTVMENVLIPTLAGQTTQSRSEIAQRAEYLLEKVGLTEWSSHRPGELSGGQRQRVAVARALINKPKLLLADEPTGSLDAESAERIGDLLIELNQSEGTALVVVTHSQTLAEKMERVLELKDGILAGE
jgi:ABC-type lipoprotein export system ATPase subunit